MSAPLEPLLHAKEAARVLGISERTFWSLVSGGKLPVVRLSARCVRVDPKDLAEFIDARRSAPVGAWRRGRREER